jgi:hypothetical protein
MPIKKLGRHGTEVSPYIDGGTVLDLGAELVAGAVQAGDWGERALSGPQDHAQRILFWLSREAISTALATPALDIPRTMHEGHNMVEVLARDALSLGDVAERHPSIMGREVSHDA